MRNPHVVPQIRREIENKMPFVAGTVPEMPSKAQPLNAALLQSQSLPFHHAVFNEALRLYPPVPFEIKQCMTDVTLPDGTWLPKGAVVFWAIWSMNRSREIWGNEFPVEEYLPERWLEQPKVNGMVDNERPSHGSKVDDVGTFRGRPAFDFPVFNGGPRACLGKRMAESMVIWIIANLTAEFEFEECGDLDKASSPSQAGTDPHNVYDQNPQRLPERRTKNSLTLPMEGGLPCRVRRVSQRA